MSRHDGAEQPNDCNQSADEDSGRALVRAVQVVAKSVGGEASTPTPTPTRAQVVGELHTAVKELSTTVKVLVRSQASMHASEAPAPAPAPAPAWAQELQNAMQEINVVVNDFVHYQESENKAMRVRSCNRRLAKLMSPSSSHPLPPWLIPVMKTTPGHPSPRPDPEFAWMLGREGPFAVGEYPPRGLVPSCARTIQSIFNHDVFDAIHWFYNEDVLAKRDCSTDQRALNLIAFLVC